MRSIARLVVAGLLIAALMRGAAARAQAPDRRLAWEHAERLCRIVDQGKGEWSEQDREGRPVFRFREVARTDDFVELHDRERGYFVRLYRNTLYLKGGNPGFQRHEEFTKVYEGQWAQ